VVTGYETYPYIKELSPEYIIANDDVLLTLDNLGLFIFVLSAPLAIHSTSDILRVKTTRNIFTAGGLSVIFTGMIVGAFMLLAYFSVGQELINFDLFPDRPSLPGSNDILMKIVKAGMLNAKHRFYELSSNHIH